MLLIYMGVSENSGFSPQIIHFNRGFPLFSPSILGFFPLFLVQDPYSGWNDPIYCKYTIRVFVVFVFITLMPYNKGTKVFGA